MSDTPLKEIVFAHDHRFLHGSDGRVWSDRGSWPWERYLRYADRLTVVTRADPLGDRDPERLDLSSRAGVRFVQAPSLSDPIALIARRAAAKRVLRDALEPADLLVARMPSELGTVALEVAAELGKPRLVELVTCTWDALWNYGTWQGRAYAPVSWIRTRQAVSRAPHVLYVTQEFLQGRYPTKGRMAGVSDVELPEPDESVWARRLARIDAGSAPFVLGLIGALDVKFKGVGVALAALGRAHSRHPELELRVLGPGDPEPWRRLAARHGVLDQTEFAGVRPSGEPVRAWLDEVDLYLQPSFQEGLPRATLEAMSRACPALGSTAGGIPELLDPECLHRPGDAATLAVQIERAAGDREWLRLQGRRNFEVAGRYAASVLDRSRSAFWDELVATAR